MQFARISRTTPEQFIMPVTNVDARSLTQGYPVGFRMAVGSASINFNNAVLSLSGTAADLPGFLGVADEDIATNAVGRVVVWGYAKSVYLSNVGTSITINSGEWLVPGAMGFFSGVAPSLAASGFKYVIASNTPAAVSAQSWASGFVKGGL